MRKKTYRPYEPKQLLLLPPSLDEWLPDGRCLVEHASNLGFPPDKIRHSAWRNATPSRGRIPEKLSNRERMRRKLRTRRGRHYYKLRQASVEPVFGQIKAARGFRQFHLRGLEKIQHEWALVCLAHNLLKLAAHRANSAA